MLQIKTILISFIIALLGGLVIFILGFQVSLWISPARTPDGHVTMAIPQMFSGLIFGFIVVLIIAYIKLKKKFRE